jgi:hypothetical protein
VERPKDVAIAVAILWTSAALSIVLPVVSWFTIPNRPYRPVLDVVQVVMTSGFLGLLAYKISIGRNWARWLFAVMWVFGALALLVLIGRAPSLLTTVPPLISIGGGLQTLLQLVALTLMFRGESRRWFLAKHS